MSGNIGLKLFSSLTFVNLFLIPLFAATPPATTKLYLFVVFIFLNSLNAFSVLTCNISSMVFWNEAARSNFSCSFFISFDVLKIAVLSPAIDKLQPP